MIRNEEMEVRGMRRMNGLTDRRMPKDFNLTHPRRAPFEKDRMKMEFFDPKADPIVHNSCRGKKENPFLLD
jgi:hypothetical protein